MAVRVRAVGWLLSARTVLWLVAMVSILSDPLV